LNISLADAAEHSSSKPGYEASALFGVGAPRNTPSQIIDKLKRGN
jgi:hypothetical protein